MKKVRLMIIVSCLVVVGLSSCVDEAKEIKTQQEIELMDISSNTDDEEGEDGIPTPKDPD